MEYVSSSKITQFLLNKFSLYLLFIVVVVVVFVTLDDDDNIRNMLSSKNGTKKSYC